MGVKGRSKAGVGRLCFGFALTIAGAALLLSPVWVDADELSDLKAQVQAFQAAVETLNAKVADLEKAQATQSEKVEQIVAAPAPAPTNKLTEGLTVGGHLKLYLFDQSWGEHNGKDQHNNSSAGLSEFILFLNKQLSDKLSIEVDPVINVTASATPSLGKDITRATSGTYAISLYRAYLTALLSNGFELKAGKFNPLFSEDYAKETWWDEFYHLPPGMCTNLAWHDTGLELYKNFDFQNWSLPVYLYALNGEAAEVDSNEGKMLLLHVAPEFFQSKLRLLGSLGWGTWDTKDDNTVTRYALGFDWKQQKFNLKGEYLHGEWNDQPLLSGGVKDAKREAYYLKALYRFTPKWRGLVEYSHANNYASDSVTKKFTGLYDNYDTVTFGVDYFVTDSSTIIGQLSFGNNERSDHSEKLDANRFTLGWRTTF